MIRRKTKTRDGKVSVGATGAAVLLLLALAALLAIPCFAFAKLRDVWREQFRVTDSDVDVVVSNKSPRRMVHPEVVVLSFGLTNGANLATVPFAELREGLLAHYPSIRDVRFQRRLPNRVTAEVVEREPLVRIGGPRRRAAGGRVADLDGMVFALSANTDQLPLVREAGDTPTPPGRTLSPAGMAAVRLVDALSDPELSGMRVLEIDTAHKNYLLLTFADYSHARIAWDQMFEGTKRSNESLRKQLRNLSSAMATRINPHTTMWIATDFGGPTSRVYANDSMRGAVRQ